jgi:hypothetical protein
LRVPTRANKDAITRREQFSAEFDGFAFHANIKRRIAFACKRVIFGFAVPKGVPKMKRRMNPRSLANLKPAWQPGEAPNPTGHHGPPRPFSRSMGELACVVLPESLRTALNQEFRKKLWPYLRGGVVKGIRRRNDIGELFPRNCTYAEAHVLRVMLSAVWDGNVNAAIECRESVEGKAPSRIEFLSTNDKLEELLSAFRAASRVPVEPIN